MSRGRILILDTSVLCCWLNVPGKETTGRDGDKWDYKRINDLLEQEKKSGSTFVLPIASLVETGNHIAQAQHSKFERAKELAQHLLNSTEASNPWTAFTDQQELWNRDGILELAETWPGLAAQGLTIGDATIKRVAEHYAVAGYHVEIITSDQGLKAYEPVKPVAVPRRRR